MKFYYSRYLIFFCETVLAINDIDALRLQIFFDGCSRQARLVQKLFKTKLVKVFIESHKLCGIALICCSFIVDRKYLC